MEKQQAKTTLEHFLSLPLRSSAEVMAEFARLPDAICGFDGGKQNFVYIPGTRPDRVLLAAHADTVWDDAYGAQGDLSQRILFEDGVYKGAVSGHGIGADDRAGCAMLMLLKDSGHSLLILDGEERGQIGAHHLEVEYPALFEEINSHAYAIQLDRRGSIDYKVYKLPVSDAFLRFIEEQTGYEDAGRNARTDIVVLCKKMCGVNLSIGYYDEHTEKERLVFDEWYHTLQIVEALLQKPQKHYPLNGEA